jgi:hypothetical protein
MIVGFMVLISAVGTLWFVNQKHVSSSSSTPATISEDMFAIPLDQLENFKKQYNIDMRGSVQIPGGVLVPKKNIELKTR